MEHWLRAPEQEPPECRTAADVIRHWQTTLDQLRADELYRSLVAAGRRSPRAPDLAGWTTTEYNGGHHGRVQRNG
jgi:hypothetical protein